MHRCPAAQATQATPSMPQSWSSSPARQASTSQQPAQLLPPHRHAPASQI
jgi:hypothetical protein